MTSKKLEHDHARERRLQYHEDYFNRPYKPPYRDTYADESSDFDERLEAIIANVWMLGLSEIEDNEKHHALQALEGWDIINDPITSLEFVLRYAEITD